MLDAYKEMQIERGLSLEAEFLTMRYDVLCRERHPDGGGSGEDFERLRESYEVLKDPVRRLRHWLELQGKKPGVVDDPGTMRLFGQVGGVMTRSGEVLQKKSEAKSVLASSLAEREAIGLLGEVEMILEVLGKEKERLLEVVGSCVDDSEEAVEDLVAVAGRLVFLDKWEGQLRERWVRLGM